VDPPINIAARIDKTILESIRRSRESGSISTVFHPRFIALIVSLLRRLLAESGPPRKIELAATEASYP
jgi:hypothetical protein